MLYREIIAVCSEIHTKHINTLCGQYAELLGALAKLRRATVSFAISVCPSVCPHGATGLLLNVFQLNLIFGYFSKIYEYLENSIFMKI
jgi:hypothetical protein